MWYSRLTTIENRLMVVYKGWSAPSVVVMSYFQRWECRDNEDEKLEFGKNYVGYVLDIDINYINLLYS